MMPSNTPGAPSAYNMVYIEILQGEVITSRGIQWNEITHQCSYFTEVRTSLSNYIPSFYENVITYP